MKFRSFILGALLVAALFCVAAYTNLSSLDLLEDLIVGTDVTVGDDITVTDAATINGLVSLDSSLYLGSVTLKNGGTYHKVQNKAGKVLRAGEIVQWDNTLVTGEEIDGDSNSLAVLVADFNAQNSFMQVMWYEDGSGTPTQDTLQLTGTGFYGETIVELLVLNGDNDTVWSTNFFGQLSDAQIPTTTAWTSNVTTLTKFAPYCGVVQATTLADTDSTLVRTDAGVVYPSAIADDAWGWILTKGKGKVLFLTRDGSARAGVGFDVDADTAGVATVNVATTNGHLNQIGYLLGNLEGAGHSTTPELVDAFIDLR